jgi:predicted small integral membrane protein
MKLDPFFVAILILAALPTAAISLRSATGWRAGIVFAAFYPALVLLVGILMIGAFISLAALGLVDLD